MASSNGSQAGTSGVTGDCEGEEQDEPSSSSHPEMMEVSEAIQNLTMKDSVQQLSDREVELSAFRAKWQEELQGSKPQLEEQEPVNEEEKAKELFLQGVELERTGKLYEAVQHYKKAMQILPDVEAQLYESSDFRADTPEEEVEVIGDRRSEEKNSSDDEELVEGEELLARLQRILARKGMLCEPKFPTKEGHMSWLPCEVVSLILRWVVSADVDVLSLERVSAVCRAFFLASREHHLWHSICVRTWGKECGSPRANGFTSWRQMYIERPRLLLNGVYISKTTYLRHGENAYQDQFYRPWYLIDYYRYLRFFPEGVVLTWTTADEPAACVSALRHRSYKHGLGIMHGHYRLLQDKVVIFIKKSNNEKKPAQASNTRFRSRRKEAATEPNEQSFHLELQVSGSRLGGNSQLLWRGYSVSSRREQWTQMELSNNKFPAFSFSRVLSYSRDCSAPLPHPTRTNN